MQKPISRMRMKASRATISMRPMRIHTLRLILSPVVEGWSVDGVEDVVLSPVVEGGSVDGLAVVEGGPVLSPVVEGG